MNNPWMTRSPYRSRLLELTAYILKEVGTIDAIASSSVIWTAICFSLLYLCGLYMHSGTAGFFAVMVALTCSPTYQILIFYPTVISVLLLGSAILIFWSRSINIKRTVLLGTVIGLFSSICGGFVGYDLLVKRSLIVIKTLHEVALLSEYMFRF